MKSLESILTEDSRFGMGLSNNLGRKYTHFIICAPTKDSNFRFLIYTTKDDPYKDASKYKIFDKWEKKYPDDKPSDWSVLISVDPEIDPAAAKKLKDIGNLIKKEKSDVLTLRYILNNISHPERKLDEIFNKMKQQGPSSK